MKIKKPVYFEACNILPTNSIPDRYKHSISECWNSLCLCPNCAAEFKYGKKNLSELISMIQDAGSTLMKSNVLEPKSAGEFQMQLNPQNQNDFNKNDCKYQEQLMTIILCSQDKDNLYIATTA